jgi:hypothetical protein
MIVKENSPTAFDELTEWCEKHLPVGSYQVVPESRSYAQTVYFNIYDEDIPFICFTPSGAYCTSGCLVNEDMCEHIRDLEATEREISH